MAAALVFDRRKALTVSAWVRVGSDKGGTIVGRLWDAPQFVLGLGVGGTWDHHRALTFEACLDCADGPCSFKCFTAIGAPVPLGAWTHVGGVFGGGELRTYIDGRPAGPPLELPEPYASAAGLSARGLAPIYAGGHPSWNILDGGSLDCPSFWREALDDGQVRALYLVSRKTCGCPEDAASAP
ncbi:MAG: hypothetical protein J3K34DRAFT_401855 [Monoraphidium minutum]|nr:MAG: hypothetical protein J3K34DRAFT_401855 [Monoraphidium minutum]